MKRPLCTLAFWLWVVYAGAQINHLNFGLERKIPSKSVYGICEDDEGRIWIGTDNGLAFFQNGTFHSIHHKLLPGMVTRVFPARDSGVYCVGTNPSGIWKVFTHGKAIKVDAKGRQTYKGNLISYSKRKRSIYFSDWKHLFEISETGFDTISKVKGKHIQAVETDLNGEVFTTNTNGIVVQNATGFDTIITEASHTSTYLADGRLVTFSTDKVNTYVNNVLEKSITWQHHRKILPMHAFAHDGVVWFTGENSGLFKYANEEVQDVSALLQMPLTQFTYVFVDSRGNTWCGTNGNGIILLPTYGYLKNYTNANGLSDNFVKSVSHVSSGVSYVVTQTNAHRFDQNLDVARLLPNYSGRDISPEDISRVNQLGEYPVISSTEINFGRNALPVMTNYGLGISGHYAHIDKNELVYGGSSWFVVAQAATTTLPLIFSRVYAEQHPFGRLTKLVEVDSGYVVSADGGMFFFNREKNTLLKMKSPQEPEGYFMGVVRSKDGTLLSTSRRNVYQWKNDSWQDIYNFDSLQSGILTGIEVDAFDHKWIGTENGLIHVSGKATTRVTTLNGLLDNHINALNYKAQDSTLWVTTAHGLSIIDVTKQIIGTPYNHLLNLKSVQVINGLKYANAPKVELKSNENSFTIAYSVDNHFELGFPEYRYRLLETGGKWKYTHESKAEFLALSPGEYTFELGARIPGNYWSPTQRLEIAIRLPFWKTWEFFTLLSLVLFAITTLIFWLRIKSIRNKNREKRTTLMKMNQLELQALNANMNPHFIFNSLNSVQHYLLPLKNAEAINYVSNLSRLIRLNMQAVGKKLVHLEGELQRTELYMKLEQERFDKALSYQIEIGFSNPTKSIWLPSMIIQPAVENAIWHGIMPSTRDGYIHIKMSLEGRFLVVSVTDNGIGLKAQPVRQKSEHESMGTYLTAERLRLQHPDNSYEIAEVLAEDGSCKGTRVDMKIKINLSE